MNTKDENKTNDADKVLDTATCSAFVRARHHDGLVHEMLKSGRSNEEIIGAMAERNEKQIEEILKLHLITPKRTIIGGKEYVYHTPDHLIPLT